MATHYKLNEEDDSFLEVPQGSMMVAAGVDGTQSWIEREKDVTVRLQISTVGVATSDGATLDAVIEVDGAVAKAQDGPSPADTHLKTIQSVQLVLKEGQRVSFKAYPQASGVRVLRTVVHTTDLK